MERLTMKDCYGHWYTNEKINDRMQTDEPYPHAYDGKPIDKLADYEDKQEQGLLIELPCKVGDYAWDLIAHYRFEITSIVINSCGTIFFKCGNKGTENYASFSIEDIGDTWMITEPKESDYWNPRSEAEEALAKMGGANGIRN